MCSLLLVACSSDDRERQEDVAVGVAFDARMGSAAAETRAKGEINEAVPTIAPANDELSYYGGFGVFGCYTGLYKYVDSNVHPDFMYNEHVTWNSTSSLWEYTPLKYWPNGEGQVSGNTGANKHYVSFMAYAPWSDNDDSNPDTKPAGYCIPSFSHQGDLGNPWLTYRLIPQAQLDKQVDLLYASHTDAHPILDLTKPAVNERIQFVFNHALACVGDKVNIICSKGLRGQTASRVNGVAIKSAKVEVTGLTIEYTLTSKARLVLWNNGEANWQTIWSEEPTCKRTVTLLDPNDHTDDETVYIRETPKDPSEVLPAALPSISLSDHGVFYIPKELSGYPQTAKVNITYRVATYNGSDWRTDTEITGSAMLTLHDYTTAPNDGYKPGKHLYINVTLNPLDIALTAAIAPWTVVGPIEMEGIED